MLPVVVATFYKLTPLNDIAGIAKLIRNFLQDHNILGTVILAQEGINSTICGSRESIDAFYKFTESVEQFKGIFFKESYAKVKPFDKLKIKMRKEIVTMGIDLQSQPANHLTPAEWDKMMTMGDDVVIVDTRNDYEYGLGWFKNAVLPPIQNFREFPEWFANQSSQYKNKKILLYCTAGIRVEKASAYAKDLGHKEVYQLQGGIQHYLQQTKNLAGNWQGSCFTFDNRVIVDDVLPE